MFPHCYIDVMPKATEHSFQTWVKFEKNVYIFINIFFDLWVKLVKNCLYIYKHFFSIYG